MKDDNKTALANDRKKAEESEDGTIYNCEICLSTDTAIKVDRKYDCKRCSEEDPEVECCVCWEIIRQSEAIIFNDHHPSYVDYICEYCKDNIKNM